MEKTRNIYSHCPICKSEDFSHERSLDCSSHILYQPSLPDRINWMRCNHCGHSFTDGFYTNEALSILFSRSNDYQIANEETIESQRYIASRMIDKISSVLNAQSGKWLDMGFGNGSLLITSQEYGFEPIGIDLRSSTVDEISRLGIEAHCIDFHTFEASEEMTVISMADVLEHVPHPCDTLTHAYKLLKPKGVLFISCPNEGCLLWELLTEKNQNPYWVELEHYHNFSRQRLYDLLETHGFTPVKYGVSERYRMGMEIIAVKN